MKKTNKKIGLALGGGSARGWAHVGVIRALLDAGIPIHCVAGTSIGSVVGAYYASGVFGELEALSDQIKWDTMLRKMDPVLPKQGLVKGDKIEKYLQDHLPICKIENLGIPYCAVAADLISGKEVQMAKGDLVDAIRASVSIPGILNPFKSDGHYLVDGGLVNPVPVSAARKLGADIVIAVDLNHDFSQTGPLSEKPEDRKTLQGKLIDWAWGKDPVIFDIIGWSVNIMQDQITQKNLLTEPADFLIRPKVGPVRAFDFHLAKPMIEEGMKKTKAILPLIKALIQ
jgi:NTE family protein